MKRTGLVLILTIALALRLANAIFLPWQGGDLIVSDMKGYDRAAMALLEQKPLSVHTAEKYLFHPLGSDTYHPPAYYYFLAGIYALVGHSYLAVRIVQAVLDMLTCGLIYGIGKEVFGEVAGLLAAAAAAIYPPLIFYTGVLLTETLSTCLLAGATWLLLRAARPAGIKHAPPVIHDPRPATFILLAGLLLGITALTRSVLLIVVPPALLWLLFIVQRWPGWSVAVRHALALCLPVALVILPVTVRNYQIHHKLVLISTNGGVNFFLGHGGSERLKNEVRNIPAVYTEDQLIGTSSRTEPQEEAYFYQLGWEYIRQHPLRTLLALPGKLREMYWDSDYWPASDAQANLMRTIDLVLWKLLFLPLSLLGLFWLPTTHGPLSTTRYLRPALLYLILLSSVIIPLLFWAQTRFRVPFVPYSIVLAAGVAYGAYGWLTQRSRAASLKANTSPTEGSTL